MWSLSLAVRPGHEAPRLHGEESGPEPHVGRDEDQERKRPEYQSERIIIIQSSSNMCQVYRAYKPYVSVVLHTPKKEKKEAKTDKREVRWWEEKSFHFILLTFYRED